MTDLMDSPTESSDTSSNRLGPGPDCELDAGYWASSYWETVAKKTGTLMWPPIMPSVAVAFIAGNLLLPRVISQWGQSVTSLVGSLILTGFFAAQPMLLATWCALGGRRAIFRIPLAAVVMAILATALGLGVRLIADTIPWPAILMVFCIATAAFAGCSVLLAIFRRLSGWTVQHGAWSSRTEETSSQMSIGYLFIMTSLVALLVGLLQAIFQSQGIRFSVTLTPQEIREAVAFGLSEIVYGFFVCLPFLWVGLARPNWKRIVFAPISFCLVTAAFLFLVDQFGAAVTGYRIDTAVTAVHYSYSLGLVTTYTVVLWIARGCGYQLVRSTSGMKSEEMASDTN